MEKLKPGLFVEPYLKTNIEDLKDKMDSIIYDKVTITACSGNSHETLKDDIKWLFDKTIQYIFVSDEESTEMLRFNTEKNNIGECLSEIFFNKSSCDYYLI